MGGCGVQDDGLSSSRQVRDGLVINMSPDYSGAAKARSPLRPGRAPSTAGTWGPDRSRHGLKMGLARSIVATNLISTMPVSIAQRGSVIISGPLGAYEQRAVCPLGLDRGPC